MTYLVADSANVTVLRSVASTAYGTYSLNVPEGIDLDDIHEFDAPGNELGYVSTLTKKRTGRFFRRFIRTDVEVTAANPTDPDWQPDSNVDAVLREAEARVSGDFFLESDITRAGLGSWIPFVDFNVGDIVAVEILGMVVRLPVTRIEPIVSDHEIIDWRVHVGGQLISDDDARIAENQVIYRALVEDRRDLAGLSKQVTQAVKDSSEAKADASDALEAVNDADGVIQGEVKKAKDYSQQSYIHSEASLLHSQKSLEHSETSQGFSQAAWDANEAAQGYAQNAWDYSEASQGYSQESLGYSETAFGHSDAARVYSEAANSASQQAQQYSQQVQDLQPVIEQAASDAQAASQQSSQHSADALSASEQSSVHSQAATDAAELSQDALRLAELARDAAETSRRDAESKRDEAEQARRAGFAAMSAASAAMAQAEQAREEAEESRRLAENERAAAEDQRRLAESARAAAETHRSNAEESRKLAFNSMVVAQNNMAMAEKQRAMAERERALAEEKRAAAEEQRRLAEGEREKAETAREQTVEAFKQTQNEIDAMQNDAIVALEEQAASLVELQNRMMNMAMVDNVGSTHPDVTTMGFVGSTAYDAVVNNITPGTKIHADFYSKASSGALSYVSSHQYVATSTSLVVEVAAGGRVANLMWARPSAQQVPISLSSSSMSLSRVTWTDVPGLSRKATGRVTSGQLTIRGTWNAANRGSTYGIRVMIGTSEFKRFTTTNLGPLSFLSDGESRYTVSVANLKMAKNQTLKVQAYSTAGSASQRSLKSVTAIGSWIEHAS